MNLIHVVDSRYHWNKKQYYEHDLEQILYGSSTSNDTLFNLSENDEIYAYFEEEYTQGNW